jgi:hypothetical protein
MLQFVQLERLEAYECLQPFNLNDPEAHGCLNSFNSNDSKLTDASNHST